RELDPELGRWTQPDPTGFGGLDVNLYRSLGGNPANSLDPTGEVVWVLAIPLVGGFLIGGSSWAHAPSRPDQRHKRPPSFSEGFAIGAGVTGASLSVHGLIRFCANQLINQLNTPAQQPPAQQPPAQQPPAQQPPASQPATPPTIQFVYQNGS